MKFSTAQSSRLGNRKNNQDRSAIFIRQHYTLLVLADGMGGHSHGEVAAQTTIDTIGKIFNNIPFPIGDKRTFLKQVFLLAHQSIQEQCHELVNVPRTTCVCCLIKDDNVIWAHSGDSRLYLIRGYYINSRTRDHSYIEDLLQQNALTAEEAGVHPMRNHVTACLGGSSKIPHLSMSKEMILKDNDFIFLCSDGLWSAIEEKQLISVLHSGLLESALDRLTNLADHNSYPNSDNTTALAMRIDDISSPYNEPPEQADDITPLDIELPRQPDESPPVITNSLDQALSDIELAFQKYKEELS